MKKIQFLLFAIITINTTLIVLPGEKIPTLKNINEKCRSKDSKSSKYREIGMTQFAKNYLKLCLNTEMQKAWKRKYTQCLINNNAKYCYRNTEIDKE